LNVRRGFGCRFRRADAGCQAKQVGIFAGLHQVNEVCIVGLAEESLEARPADDGIVLSELLDHALPDLFGIGRLFADCAQVEQRLPQRLECLRQGRALGAGGVIHAIALAAAPAA
jgi:hypothetical protein